MHPARPTILLPPVEPAPVETAAVGGYLDQFDALEAQVHAQLGIHGSTDLAIPGWMLHTWSEITGPGAPMAMAHLVAAVLVGLWLARGESALWSLIGLLTGAVVRLARIVVLSVPVVSRVRQGHPDSEPCHFLSLVHGRCVTHRGPPMEDCALP